MSGTRPDWAVNDSEVWLRWWNSVPKDQVLFDSMRPMQGELLSDSGACVLALLESLRGSGSVSPNPLVGAVIRSRESLYLASGAHLKFGGPHAEINALSQLPGGLPDGAKLTVTLEPCAHQGKTPPCADRLASLPLSEVQYLLKDPDFRVNGRGAAKIKSAGIACIENTIFSEAAADVTEIFLFNAQHKDVFIGLKAATSQDAVYASSDSSRHWITNERSRQYGHYLRLRYDSILVGADTVLKDNPSLNIRSPYVSGRTPLRIVFDSRGKLTNPNFAVFDESVGQTLLVVHADSLPTWKSVVNKRGIEIIALKPNKFGRFLWSDLKKALWSRGVRSLLIEGGGKIWDDALNAKVVQKIHWFVAQRVQEISNPLFLKQLQSIVPVSESCYLNLNGDRYYEHMIS